MKFTLFISLTRNHIIFYNKEIIFINLFKKFIKKRKKFYLLKFLKLASYLNY